MEEWVAKAVDFMLQNPNEATFWAEINGGNGGEVEEGK
eukprot:CAMPEP_0171393270 /NCGR_PEP_ID=MMETSP0880-20121228/2558_1 /TAXON_ID=67004 /ORGANISM="Thalassiosira weissflogii, Strain CCMP1336" /LENGTH=37 /DNA_ID= /DNA_START= /DNA_END= /DNA_ORIENTATION=